MLGGSYQPIGEGLAGSSPALAASAGPALGIGSINNRQHRSRSSSSAMAFTFAPPPSSSSSSSSSTFMTLLFVAFALSACLMTAALVVGGDTPAQGLTRPPPVPSQHFAPLATPFQRCSDPAGAVAHVAAGARAESYMHPFELARVHPCCVTANHEHYPAVAAAAAAAASAAATWAPEGWSAQAQPLETPRIADPLFITTTISSSAAAQSSNIHTSPASSSSSSSSAPPSSLPPSSLLILLLTGAGRHAQSSSALATWARNHPSVALLHDTLPTGPVTATARGRVAAAKRQLAGIKTWLTEAGAEADVLDASDLFHSSGSSDSGINTPSSASTAATSGSGSNGNEAATSSADAGANADAAADGAEGRPASRFALQWVSGGPADAPQYLRADSPALAALFAPANTTGASMRTPGSTGASSAVTGAVTGTVAGTANGGAVVPPTWQFALIVPDDAWVSLPALLQRLAGYAPGCPLALGHVYSHAWLEADDHPALTGGLVLSRAAAAALARSLLSPRCPYYISRGVSLGRCLWATGTQLVHLPGLSPLPPRRSNDRLGRVAMPEAVEALALAAVRPAEAAVLTDYVLARRGAGRVDWDLNALLDPTVTATHTHTSVAAIANTAAGATTAAAANTNAAAAGTAASSASPAATPRGNAGMKPLAVKGELTVLTALPSSSSSATTAGASAGSKSSALTVIPRGSIASQTVTVRTPVASPALSPSLWYPSWATGAARYSAAGDALASATAAAAGALMAAAPAQPPARGTALAAAVAAVETVMGPVPHAAIASPIASHSADSAAGSSSYIAAPASDSAPVTASAATATAGHAMSDGLVDGHVPAAAALEAAGEAADAAAAAAALTAVSATSSVEAVAGVFGVLTVARRDPREGALLGSPLRRWLGRLGGGKTRTARAAAATKAAAAAAALYAPTTASVSAPASTTTPGATAVGTSSRALSSSLSLTSQPQGARAVAAHRVAAAAEAAALVAAFDQARADAAADASAAAARTATGGGSGKAGSNLGSSKSTVDATAVDAVAVARAVAAAPHPHLAAAAARARSDRAAPWMPVTVFTLWPDGHPESPVTVRRPERFYFAPTLAAAEAVGADAAAWASPAAADRALSVLALTGAPATSTVASPRSTSTSDGGASTAVATTATSAVNAVAPVVFVPGPGSATGTALALLPSDFTAGGGGGGNGGLAAFPADATPSEVAAALAASPLVPRVMLPDHRAPERSLRQHAVVGYDKLAMAYPPDVRKARKEAAEAAAAAAAAAGAAAAAADTAENGA